MYVPASWLFIERITSSYPWVGVRAGACAFELNDLHFLTAPGGWCEEDEVLKLCKARLGAPRAEALSVDEEARKQAEQDKKEEEARK